MTRLITALLLVGSFAFASSAALANSSNPPSPPFTTTSTQGGSTNTCNDNPGCTDTKQNPAGNNSTCDGPDGQCTK
jgi:hypothetical protein